MAAMHASIITTIALSASIFLPGASARETPRKPRVDPSNIYLGRMCSPNLTNTTRAVDLRLSPNELFSSLADSPFPCEKQQYIQVVCTANGTTEIDFLAEQQCLCNGGYWEALRGCDACYHIHGYRGSPPLPEAEYQQSTSSYASSLSSAECSPSPPFQPFSNLFPPISDRISSMEDAPFITLTTDVFPNSTAVSNYFTPTASLTPGEITGSATARLTTWTNYSGIRYTPTSTPNSTESATTASTSVPSNSDPAANPTSTNGAVVAAGTAGSAGCLVSILLGLGLQLL